MATVTKCAASDGSDAWRARICIKRQGKTIYEEARTFQIESNAEVWANGREHELEDSDELSKSINRGTTLKHLLRAYIADSDIRMGHTKHSHLLFLQGTELAKMDLAELRQLHFVEHVRERLETGALPATVSNDLIWLRTVARWALPFDDYPMDVDEIEKALVYCQQHNYVTQSKTRDRRPTSDELWRLSEYFDACDPGAKLPMQDIMWFAVHSGRRQAEITRLLWSDNDYDERSGLVRNLEHPRRQEPQNVRFKYSNSAWEIVQRQPGNDLRIFPYNSKSVGAAFNRACHHLKIEDLRFQDLRHEATCRLIESGHSLPEVQQFTLHLDGHLLRKYLHLRPREVAQRRQHGA